MGMMLLVKASVVLTVSLALARLLAASPAVARHRRWTLSFSCVLTLPLLGYVLPVLEIPLLMQSTSFEAEAMPQGQPRPLGDGRDGVWRGAVAQALRADAMAPLGARTGATGSARAATWLTTTVLLGVWLSGFALAAGALVVSLLRARAAARAAQEFLDPTWRASVERLQILLGLRQPVRLLIGHAVTTPMAGGIWRPVIFLPVHAATWDDDQRDVVLAHEIAHLARWDPLRHVVARLAVAFYWFLPLSWIAAKHATVAREQACDETVLALGTLPSVYARVLLTLAEAARTPPPAFAALPMVDRSFLETRVMTILNDDVRPTARRGGLLCAAGVGFLTLSVAAAQPGSAAEKGPGSRSASATSPGPLAFIATPPTAPASTVVPQDRALDSACVWESSGSFEGSLSTSDSGGRSVIHEQVGSRGTDRVIQRSFGDYRLCMVAEGVGEPPRGGGPSQWLTSATGRILMEARRGGRAQRLEIRRQGGRQTLVWEGQPRSSDAGIERWRDRMLAVFDTTWELSMLRGEVSSLRGQISSVRGQESSLRGEISSLRGHVSSLRGQISSLRGSESSLRGEISAIRGHVSSLRGAISSERGAISSSEASRYRASDAERALLDKQIAGHQERISLLEREIRDFDADGKVADVERQIRAQEFDRQTAAVEAEIRAFDLESRVAAVERQIASLDVEGKVREIERQITALDAERRGRELEVRRDRELSALEAAIAAVK